MHGLVVRWWSGSYADNSLYFIIETAQYMYVYDA